MTDSSNAQHREAQGGLWLAPVIAPEERAKVGEGLKQLAEGMRGRIELEDTERKAEQARRAVEDNDRLILAEYARLGIEPRYSGGQLVSPSLLRATGQLPETSTSEQE